MTLADELIAWVEQYAKKVCPDGCLPTPGQEREINLFARITRVLQGSDPAQGALDRDSASAFVRRLRQYNAACLAYDLSHDEAIDALLALPSADCGGGK